MKKGLVGDTPWVVSWDGELEQGFWCLLHHGAKKTAAQGQLSQDRSQVEGSERKVM